jgi:hypothetical protein
VTGLCARPRRSVEVGPKPLVLSAYQQSCWNFLASYFRCSGISRPVGSKDTTARGTTSFRRMPPSFRPDDYPPYPGFACNTAQESAEEVQRRDLPGGNDAHLAKRTRKPTGDNGEEPAGDLHCPAGASPLTLEQSAHHPRQHGDLLSSLSFSNSQTSLLTYNAHTVVQTEASPCRGVQGRAPARKYEPLVLEDHVPLGRPCHEGGILETARS